MSLRQKSLFRFALPLFLGLALAFFLTASIAVGGSSVIMRVSTDSAGVQADGNSGRASLSADGRYIAFYSDAANLVPGDTNGVGDVYLKDTLTGQTVRISSGSAGNQGAGHSWFPSISADGRYVAFESVAANLVQGDTNSSGDVFLKDTSTGQTIRISTDSAGRQGIKRSGYPAMSAGGRYVAFSSLASNLAPADTNGTWDVLVKDISNGRTTTASSNSSGQAGNDWSYWSSISADGRYVAYHSNASNLVAADFNAAVDVFIKDTLTGQTSRASTGANGNEANGNSWCPSMSADGRYLAFYSSAANLVPGDTNGTWDIFLKDVQTGQTKIISSDSAGRQGNGWSIAPSISADGRYIAYISSAANLVFGDTNMVADVFVKDSSTGLTTRVTIDHAGRQADNHGYHPAISDNGSNVAFESSATNLIPGDTNEKYDVFLSPVHFGLRPQLSLSFERIYWATYTDFILRRLSVTLSVTNPGSRTAYGVQAVEYTATENVSMITAMPVSLGDIPGGASQVLTFKYKIPPLVQEFQTGIHVTVRDECCNAYDYNEQAKIQLPLLPDIVE